MLAANPTFRGDRALACVIGRLEVCRTRGLLLLLVLLVLVIPIDPGVLATG